MNLLNTIYNNYYDCKTFPCRIVQIVLGRIKDDIILFTYPMALLLKQTCRNVEFQTQ